MGFHDIVGICISEIVSSGRVLFMLITATIMLNYMGLFIKAKFSGVQDARLYLPNLYDFAIPIKHLYIFEYLIIYNKYLKRKIASYSNSVANNNIFYT